MSAYWIARITVHDPEGYGLYAKGAGPVIESFGGRFLARGGKAQTLEGRDHQRNVVVEFPDVETAHACYNSPAYQEVLVHALKAAERDVVIVEGA